MLRDKLQITMLDAAGNVQRQKPFTIQNLDGTLATVFSSAFGNTGISSSLKTDDNGTLLGASGLDIFCAGLYRVVDAAGQVVLPYIAVQGLRFSPMNYKAVGNGIANDTQAVTDCIAAAKAFAALSGGKISTVFVDGESKTYAVTGITVTGSYTTGVANLHLGDFNLVPYGIVEVGAPLLSTRGNRVCTSNVFIDGKGVAGGLSSGSFSSMNHNVRVSRFRGVGIDVTLAGGQMIDKCEVIQWSTDDPEYLIREEWDATCFRVDHADCRFTNCNGHFAGLIVDFTNDATTTLLHNCNFYNANNQHNLPGNEAVYGDFFALQLMRFAQDSGGIQFTGCYLGNGTIDIYGGSPIFRGCIAITKYSQDRLPYFIGWHADNPNSSFGRQAAHEGWTYIGPDFANNQPNKTPFYALIEEDGNYFVGDFYHWLTSEGGTMRLGQSEHWTGNIASELLRLHLHGPGSGGDQGAAFELSSGSTPMDIASGDLPGLREIDGGAFLYRASMGGRGRDIVGTVATPNASLFRGSSGQHVNVEAQVDTTIKLPKIAHKNWYCYVTSSIDSVADVIFDPEAGAVLKSMDQIGGAVRISKPGGRALLVCTGNSDGQSAVFYASGDVNTERTVAAGDGVTFLFPNQDHAEVLVQNTGALSRPTLPHNAPPGWRIGITNSATSAFVARIRTNPAQAGSALWTLTDGTDYVLDPGVSAEAICVANADGVSAKYVIRGGLGVQADSLRVDPSKYPFFLNPAAADNTTGLQAIIDALHAISSARDIHCTLVLNQMWKWSSLKLYDTVSIDCPSLSDSGGYQIPGAVGPMLELNPWDGRKGGVRRQQSIKGRFDGQLSGMVKATGATAAGSNQLTGITPADITTVQVDWFVEGIGIPPLTTVTGFGAGRTSLTMSANAVGANGARNKIVFRPTIKRTATATANSAVLAVADTTGIVPGMRVYGSPLETDGDDLNQWSRVKSVVANTSVTLDRKATGSGSFQCYFYVKNDGILITEAAFAPGYDGIKEFGQVDLEVHVTNMSGHAVCARPGRDQIHLKKPSKLDACYGGGLVVTACHDCWFEVVGGSHWEECVLISSSSTPQFGGTDQYQTYLTDRCYDMRWQGIRESNTYNLNINGRYYIKGKNGEAQPIITLISPMFKFTLVNMVPYGDTDAYIVADNAIVNMVGGGFKGDRTAVPANQGRPKWIGRTLNGGIINITGTNWPDNPTTDQPATVDGCPYSTAITNEGRLFAQRINNVTGRLTQFETNFTPTLSAATPGDLSCAYATQYGFLSIMNGMAYVDIQLDVTPTATTASGNLEIRGLPVAPNADRTQPPLSVIANGAALDFGTGYTQLMAHASGLKVILDKMGDNKAAGSVTVANIVSGQPISIQIFGWFKV